MKTKIPIKKSIRFNPQMIPVGTPLTFFEQGMDSPIFAMVQEYGINTLTLRFNRPVGEIRYLEVNEVNSGKTQIIPINDEEGGRLILEADVFDIDRIPDGCLLQNSDGEVFFLTDKDPYYLNLIDHSGSPDTLEIDLLIEAPKEFDDWEIHVPPAVAQEWKESLETLKQSYVEED